MNNFYTILSKTRGDSEALQASIRRVVEQMKTHSTEYSSPGMLLGKIQSGKTRAFIGVIAEAFDNDYDVAIILTKGTKALTEQTVQRINEDLSKFIENDQIQVFDILHMPENLRRYELQQKLVIVTKKEINNMKRIIKILSETYPDLKDKRILIIDDEADFASLSFRKDKNTGNIEQGKIASSIDVLRTISKKTSFLEVTATPYSLYLQPDNNDTDSMIFKPKKPAFTELLPIHDAYVGGSYYFGESNDSNSTAYYVYEEVSSEERIVLKQPDGRRFQLNDVLVSKAIRSLRKSIVTFLVGGTIRRLQQEKQAENLEKYSLVIHTEMARRAHDWQVNIVDALINSLQAEAKMNTKLISDLIFEGYDELYNSLKVLNINLITFTTVKEQLIKYLIDDYVMIARVNSDNDVKQLLDDKGQLKLRTPFNIFIGGQILDRGITIKNLIGFYYGRNPQKFQQDTVLQHSRMYGVRSKEDLAVTRLYTTQKIYEIMHQINEFDEALRDAFLKGSHENGVYFIRKDANNKLVPCSPNKILMSEITTIRPYKRFLPIGFQTGYKTHISRIIYEIDHIILDIKKYNQEQNGGYLVDVPIVINILREVHKSLEFEDKMNWDLKSILAVIEHLSKISDNTELHNKVWVIIRENMNMSRRKEDGRYSDDPDGGRAEGSSRSVARKLAIDIPAIILTRQNGEESREWRGAPFWWPVIVAPKNTQTSIFANDTIEN